MKDNYRAQIHLLAAIREFFNNKNFYDVLTPPLVENPGMEVHIHPFEVNSVYTQGHSENKRKGFLHTSPEFWMKNFLSHGLEKIFTLTYCFRDEPSSPWHRNQFLMLEWYRSYEFYEVIMQDCFELIKHCCHFLEKQNIHVSERIKNASFEKMTIQEAFQKFLDIDILEYLEKNQITKLLNDRFPDVPFPGEDCEWDDYFFLLFLNKIEPELKNYPFLILYNYPAHLAALSTINVNDNRICDRFELYCEGIELANCFNELTDLNIQKNRFHQQAMDKKRLYQYQLPNPEQLYASLERGMQESCGIALGVERLLKILTNSQFDFILEN